MRPVPGRIILATRDTYTWHFALEHILTELNFAITGLISLAINETPYDPPLVTPDFINALSLVKLIFLDQNLLSSDSNPSDLRFEGSIVLISISLA